MPRYCRPDSSAQTRSRRLCKSAGAVSSEFLGLPHHQLLTKLYRPFDRESVWVRLYWRPADNRARILIMTKDNAGRQLHYCTPLNNLRLVRQGTCLQLCRLRRNGSLQLWANLNFVLYERTPAQQPLDSALANG